MQRLVYKLQTYGVFVFALVPVVIAASFVQLAGTAPIL